MKLLIDENLQPAYRRFFKSPNVQPVSVRFMNWQGKKNGELLRLMKANGFDAILTSDKLMYSDQQLEMHNLLFFLIQTIRDDEEYRTPYLRELNKYITENLFRLNKATSARIVVTDGIVDSTLKAGVHVIWIRPSNED